MLTRRRVELPSCPRQMWPGRETRRQLPRRVPGNPQTSPGSLVVPVVRLSNSSLKTDKRCCGAAELCTPMMHNSRHLRRTVLPLSEAMQHRRWTWHKVLVLRLEASPVTAHQTCDFRRNRLIPRLSVNHRTVVDTCPCIVVSFFRRLQGRIVQGQSMIDEICNPEMQREVRPQSRADQTSGPRLLGTNIPEGLLQTHRKPRLG